MTTKISERLKKCCQWSLKPKWELSNTEACEECAPPPPPAPFSAGAPGHRGTALVSQGQHLVVKFISHRAFPSPPVHFKTTGSTKIPFHEKKARKGDEPLANKQKQFEICTSQARQYLTGEGGLHERCRSCRAIPGFPALPFKNVLKNRLFDCFEAALPRAESSRSFPKQSALPPCASHGSSRKPPVLADERKAAGSLFHTAFLLESPSPPAFPVRTRSPAAAAAPVPG